MAFWARAGGEGHGWRRRAAAAAVVAATMAVAGPARGATLNEHCIVSVLNRSAKVQADGSWVLPNVPSNIGRVRVRATCVENGITRSGQSEYFTITRNGATKVPAILFDDASPVPSRLDVTVADATFHSIGATAQLATRATYPGGTTLDVTQAVRGTNYTTSNPAIVSVSEDGLVTARASGIAIVTALNDGASGLLRLSVVLTGDTDGDGIPDDVEIANGLNPNDPVDALEDFDHDGLTNYEELMVYGTDIRKADTDGDGLTDGDEVHIYHTNPLVFDTDGDGIGDGLEVGTGSNPLDPNSFNLGSALQSIEVKPSVVVLVVNQLVGEASRQLQVTGHLTDGRTLDLTSTSRGTNYASSDLSVVNFGGTDGQIFAGSDGTATVTVSIPNTSFSANVSVRVRSFTPQRLSFLQLPGNGYANNVDVAGDHAYIAFGNGGLLVVDVADRTHPQIVGTLEMPGGIAIDVRVVGNLAYVADGPLGLQIVNVADPTHPVLVGTLHTPGVAEDLVLRGNRAFIAAGTAGLQIADVTNPAAPVLIGSVATPGEARGVDVSGTLAVIAAGFNQLSVVDVSTPNAPVLKGSVSVPGEVMDVTARDRVAYVSAYTGSLQTVDFSNPDAPVVVPIQPGQQSIAPRDFEMNGRFGIAAEQLFPNIVAIFELSNPLAPNFAWTIDFEPLADYAGTGIALDASYVYMTGESYFVFQSPYGTVGNTGFFIGKYLEVSDDAGIPPTVTITSPAAGSEHIAGSTVTVHAEATDDVGVAGVTFSVDGVPFSTDFIAPFELSYTLPANVTSVTFGATATDFGGNVGTAPTVTVQVIPDPAPVLTITSPADGAQVIEGQTITLTANATDNVSVRQVSFTVNGTTLTPGTFNQPSVTHSQTYVVGIGVTQLVITATATDNLGQAGSASRTVTVVPDPKTTVVGRVIDTQLLPVADANVSAFGVFTAHTGADGTFTIPNVPSVRGNVIVSAEKLLNGETLSGTSEAFPAVRGGTTDVGTIQLTSLHLQPEGTLLDPAAFGFSLDDGFARVDLPFPFTFYGVAYDHVFVGTNGYLTFVNGDTNYGASVPAFNNQPRIAPQFNDWQTPQSGGNGIFVNTDVPGRFVVTWRNIHLCCGNGTPNGSFQVVLGADGKIQFGYDGVTPLYGLVGITPGSATPQAFDFSQTPNFSVDATTAPYEQFFGLNNNPFDLDHSFLSFTPNGAGGYDGQLRIPPPIVTLTSPAAGATLVQGQTILVAATPSVPERMAQMDFSVNGLALLPDATNPFSQSFQVPLGVSGLTFSATATDTVGQSISTSRTVNVVPDASTTVRGTIVDESNVPVSGAQVVLDQNGLKGEFFDFDAPLSAMPDLTGLSPTSVRLVSSLDFRNPGQMFNSDTFGVGLAPNFAARFTGLIKIDTPGEYRFYLAADDGATLRIDGTTVVTVTPTGSLAEASGTITLTGGTHPIEVQYFQSTGDAQLQLSYAPPAGPTPQRQTVPATAFVISPPVFTATTDASGAFSFAGVPTSLGQIRLSARATVGGEVALGGTTAAPVAGGITDLGAVKVVVTRVVGYYDLSQGQGAQTQVSPIVAAGLTPQTITDLSADLSPYHILFVQNPNNGGYSSAYLNNVARISDWITSGGVLVFHDRHVSTAATILPGAPGNIFRDFADDRNVDIVDNTTAVTNGPGGILDNSSLDNGNSSSHGYIDAATIPAGARGILSRTNPAQLVLYAYPFGRGWVVYSTMPLDFYLGGQSGLSGTFTNVYAPNVLAFARALRRGGVVMNMAPRTEAPAPALAAAEPAAPAGHETERREAAAVARR